MKYIIQSLIVILATLFVRPVSANLDIFTCEPEWAALAGELGGANITTYSATTALQDPHQIQARPSLLARARRADLMICTGAELESGWLPLIQRQAGNSKIQPGQSGYFQAADYVPMLETPTRLDRSAGDIHSRGNPHIQTDPRNIALVARELATRMAALDPAQADHYATRYKDFSARWEAAVHKWESEAAPLKGTPIVVHHKSWAYLENWLGLQEIATLEPKPGLPPSSAHLEKVLAQLQAQPARVIIRTAYQDPKASAWLSERAGIPAVMLPGTVGGTPETDDLFSLFEVTVHELLKVVQK